MDVRSTDVTGFAAVEAVRLTRFAYLVCGDHGLAEDLVQETLLAIFRRFGSEIRVDDPVAYARRAIVNAAVSRRRRRSAREPVLRVVPDRVDDSGWDADGHAEQDAMWRVLAELDRRPRAVLVLRYYYGLADAEIATTLDCRPGTVRSIAARAFAVLRRHPDLARMNGEQR